MGLERRQTRLKPVSAAAVAIGKPVAVAVDVERSSRGEGSAAWLLWTRCYLKR